MAISQKPTGDVKCSIYLEQPYIYIHVYHTTFKVFYLFYIKNLQVQK